MLKNNQNPKDFNDVDGLSITENDDIVSSKDYLKSKSTQ